MRSGVEGPSEKSLGTTYPLVATGWFAFRVTVTVLLPGPVPYRCLLGLGALAGYYFLGVWSWVDE